MYSSTLLGETPEDRPYSSEAINAGWRSSVFNTLSQSQPDKEVNSDFRKQLIEGVLFSRRFVLSYQLVVAGALLAFTVVHWTTLLQRRRRRRLGRAKHAGVFKTTVPPQGTPKRAGHGQCEDRDTEISSSSSSSSTLQGTESPRSHFKVDAADTESTPLLPKQHGEKAKPEAPVFLSSRLRAWLNYQPQPIPIVDKTLPSNGTSLAVLGLILVNIFYVVFRVPFSIPMLFIFADRTSLMIVANLPLFYILAAKNQPVKLLTGYSYESLNIVHRRLGEILCLLALLHGVGMVGVWYTILKPVGVTFVRFLLLKTIILGIGALIAYELLYITSLRSFRQRWYELFLGAHVFLQAAALVLLWFHHSTSRVYVAVALAIFLIDRLAYRMAVKRKMLRASIKTMEDGNTVALSVTVPIKMVGFIQTTFGSAIGHGWKPTEHVFLTVPSLARKHAFQAHPFTIASRAPASSSSEASLDLIVRAQDGFSAELNHYAKHHNSATVILDGPYGSQAAVRLLQDSDLSVIVAGGSGIAVAWPLAWSLLEGRETDDIEQHAPIRTKQIVLIWVVHKRSHLNWIGSDGVAMLRRCGVEVVLPEPTEECGRPDVKTLIESWVSTCGNLPTAKIGVVCSGPDGMNRTVRNSCASLMAQGWNVHVEIEKFGW